MGPRSFCFRVSDDDAVAFRATASALGLGLTDTFVLFCRYAETTDAPPVVRAPMLIDGTTAHELVREIRSIGTLYNQSVAALNTVARFIRECDADADDARIVLGRVDSEMQAVLDGLNSLRESAAKLTRRPVILP